MKNLNIEGLTELSDQNIRLIQGGWILPLIIAMGGLCAWTWSKGEQMGKALAQHH